MGGDIDACDAALPVLRRLFDGAAIDPEDVKAIARRFKLNAVIVTDADAVWGNPAGWIYRRTPDVVTPNARAFLFASPAAPTAGR